MSKRNAWRTFAALALGTTLAAVVVPSMSSASTAGLIPGVKVRPARFKPRHGGSMTILTDLSGGGAGWTTLNPLSNKAGGAATPAMDAVFGTLFAQSANGQVVPDLATGYKFTDGDKTLTIHLRHGATFSDGTPFNSQAVAYNFTQDLKPSTDCLCAGNFPLASMSTPNPYTVILTLKVPDSDLINVFPSENPDWIISPTALARDSAQVTNLEPVGAGPFIVQSDTPNVEIILVRNPHYYAKGLPYLNKITIKAVSNDSSALAALQSGEAQVYGGYGEYQNIGSITGSVNVYETQESVSPDAILFNTTKPPFNNILARQAITYATNPEPINRALFNGTATYTQSPTGPGGLFYEPIVPGYDSYNLKKAKALVKQLGGLSATLISYNDLLDQEIDDALQTQWKAAGITLTIDPVDTTTLIADHGDGNWELSSDHPGAYDPAVATGLRPDFSSAGFLSGDRDPVFDSMLDKSTQISTTAGRAAAYRSIFKYLDDHAYADFLFVAPLFLLTTKNVTWPLGGPGLEEPPFNAFYGQLAYTNTR
ncbi:MAG: ABC transporter substrate-binding protein [Acidimicrobiales bacterium]